MVVLDVLVIAAGVALGVVVGNFIINFIEGL